MSAKKFVGLDFGTTNSAIAITDAEGNSELAAFPDGNDLTTTFRSILYSIPKEKETKESIATRSQVRRRSANTWRAKPTVV